MNLEERGIDFAFVDAENVHRSLQQYLERLNFTPEEIELVSFADLIGLGGSSSPGWPNHSRRFVYFATEGDEIPEWLKECGSRAGFILRTGRLTRKGKVIKQQGVDVLLAVETLQQSHRRTMNHCTIYSGDGDFLPLVDELVAIGTFVRVRSFDNPEKSEVARAFERGVDMFDRFNVWDIFSALPFEVVPIGSGDYEEVPEATIIEPANTDLKLGAIVLRGDEILVVGHKRSGRGVFEFRAFSSLRGAGLYRKLRLIDYSSKRQFVAADNRRAAKRWHDERQTS